MADKSFKIIKVECECEYARILEPYNPDWNDGIPLYSIALRLADAQVHKLRTIGYKGNPKISQRSGKTIYNFHRNTMSLKGNQLPDFHVVDWNKMPVTALIGDGSKVIALLEYWPYESGTDSKGNRYPGGMSWRLGAVQMVNHIVFEEKQIDSRDILNKFDVLPKPEDAPDSHVDKFDVIPQAETQNYPPPVENEDYMSAKDPDYQSI